MVLKFVLGTSEAGVARARSTAQREFDMLQRLAGVPGVVRAVDCFGVPQGGVVVLRDSSGRESLQRARSPLTDRLTD